MSTETELRDAAEKGLRDIDQIGGSMTELLIAAFQPLLEKRDAEIAEIQKTNTVQLLFVRELNKDLEQRIAVCEAEIFNAIEHTKHSLVRVDLLEGHLTAARKDSERLDLLTRESWCVSMTEDGKYQVLESDYSGELPKAAVHETPRDAIDSELAARAAEEKS